MARKPEVPRSDLVKIICIGHVTMSDMQSVSPKKGSNSIFERISIKINIQFFFGNCCNVNLEINCITFAAFLIANQKLKIEYTIKIVYNVFYLRNLTDCYRMFNKF